MRDSEQQILPLFISGAPAELLSLGGGFKAETRKGKLGLLA